MSARAVVNGIAPSVERCAIGEELLVAAAQEGQEWAFEELCTRNSKRVFRTIYRVTKNWEDTEDALQDSTMRAFLNLKRFDGRSSFATWFTRIAINSALTILRKRRVHLESSIDAAAEGEARQRLQIPDNSPDPEEQYAERERSRHLKRAICALPDSLRHVVERGQLQGHSMQEIAREMGISIPVTKSRVARARVVLRKLMISAQGTAGAAD
jgi:RNA polymerase sigma-70 factor (ECF subfamily)